MNSFSNYSTLAHHFQKVQSYNHPSTTPINHLYLFSNSPYTLHIISADTSHKIYSISSEQPIACFLGFQIPSQYEESFLVIVNTLGTMQGNRWIIYNMCRNKRRMGYEVNSQIMGMNTSVARLVNVHYLDSGDGIIENNKLLWIFENGQIEYCTFLSQKQMKPICTKQYKIQRKKNGEYSGRQFLKELTTEHKIGKSILNHANKTLILVILNNSSKDISSVYQFTIYPQEYEILAGPDNLLSLDSIPLSIQVISTSLQKKGNFSYLIFQRESVKLWSSKGLTTHTIPPLSSTVTQVNTNSYLLISANSIYLLSLQYQQNIKITQLQQHTHPDSLLSLRDSPLSKSYYIITNRLQVVKIQENTPTTIISNSYTSILSAQLYFGPFHNYLTFKKMTGFNQQHVLLTNNQVVIQKDEYQHNMLLKMVDALNYSGRKCEGSVWLSSPIIGTLQLNVKITKENEFILEGSRGGKIRTNMQSLFLYQNNTQITSSDLLYKDKIHSVELLFEGKVDYIISGCICGYFAVLGLQKQVHVFSLQNDPPKRIAIHVFDDDVKKVINLNDVNFIGVVLWDLSFTILSISENSIQPIKNQSTQNWSIQPDLHYVHSSQVIINTQKFICTILSGFMILCSSDTLHLYQPEKTVIHLFQLHPNVFGRQCFPVLDLNGQTDNKLVLMKAEDKEKENCNSFRLVKIGQKYLVKDFKEIKFEVEQIIGYPENAEQLLFVAVKDSCYLLVCTSKIITFTTQTGKIGIDETKHLSSFLNKFKYSHLAMQIKSEEQELTTVIFNKLLSLSSQRYLLWNQQQIWLVEPTSQKNKNITIAKSISYFSMPNDAFLEFRNNLSIQELEDPQFMSIFAKKQPIKTVAKITGTKFAVLYENSIVIVEVGVAEVLVIQQEISFKNCMQVGEQNNQYVKITNFIGFYDTHSLYLKDNINHRLFVLKYSKEKAKYDIIFLKDLEVDEEFVCIHRVRQWKIGSRKMKVSGITQENQNDFEELIIKKDGQMTIGNSLKPIYL